MGKKSDRKEKTKGGRAPVQEYSVWNIANSDQQFEISTRILGFVDNAKDLARIPE
jgi:hypothetical protein